MFYIFILLSSIYTNVNRIILFNPFTCLYFLAQKYLQARSARDHAASRLQIRAFCLSALYRADLRYIRAPASVIQSVLIITDRERILLCLYPRTSTLSEARHDSENHALGDGSLELPWRIGLYWIPFRIDRYFRLFGPRLWIRYLSFFALIHRIPGPIIVGTVSICPVARTLPPETNSG